MHRYLEHQRSMEHKIIAHLFRAIENRATGWEDSAGVDQCFPLPVMTMDELEDLIVKVEAMAHALRYFKRLR